MFALQTAEHGGVWLSTMPGLQRLPGRPNMQADTLVRLALRLGLPNVVETPAVMRHHLQAVSKPTIFSALSHTFAIPRISGVDLMQLIALNVTELFCGL